MRRTSILLAVAAGCSAPPAPGATTPPETRAGDRERQPFALAEASIAELQRQMSAGERTAVDIARLYLERIAAIDSRGPALRAVIEINPDALAIAAALDRERAARGPRGPLHGIPVLLKDNIATADKMETTAGSLALVGHRPGADAFLVARLRAAGAVILGKTNLSEWANFRSSRSSSGWSARGGQTRNPYVLDRSPCGSSSGSGVAVAANLVTVAIGTETDGSIVCPSSANGIVGIKPTVGLVSRAQIIPIAHSQDTAGPMARTVADAAAVLTAIAGADSNDPATAAFPGARDYTKSLDPDALAGARIGVARPLFGSDPAVIALMESAIAAMREAGAVIVDPVELAPSKAMGDAEYQVLLYEFKADIAGYLEGLGGGAPKTLDDLIGFNKAHADTELAHFGQEIFIEAAGLGGLDDPRYSEALATSRRLARAEGIDRVIAAHQLDAIIAPTGSPAWPIDLINGDHYTLGTSSFAAIAGYPNISVPIGDVSDLPVGVSIFGPAWSEPRLIAIAYAFEQKTRARRPPRFLGTVRYR